MTRPIVLLKSPPRDPAADDYVKQATASGYTPFFIEVLESVFANGRELQDIVRLGPRSFLGVVITSSRAAEAWIHAVQSLYSPGDWSQTPFYVVGKATARSLERIMVSHPDKFSSSLILGADESGKSESLAQFVLMDLQSRGREEGQLLYLTGDKNRDTFHRIMNEGSINVHTLGVYETKAASDLAEKIEHVALEIQKSQDNEGTAWIAFFAPSSSNMALPDLRRFFRFPEGPLYSISGSDSRIPAKLAAIGPTTAEYLRSDQFFRVDAVAPRPTPYQLVASIRMADSNECGAGP